MPFLKHVSRIMASFALLGLAVAPASFADPPRGDRGGYDRGDRGARGGHRGGDRHRGDRGSRRDGRGSYHGDSRHGGRGSHDSGRSGRHYAPRADYYRHAPRYHRAPPRYYRPAPRYAHRYIRRPHVPRYYRPRYVIGGYYHVHPRTVIIRDYRYYGLYDPPYGYQWVYDYGSGDAVLRSIATGAVIGLVLGAIIAD